MLILLKVGQIRAIRLQTRLRPRCGRCGFWRACGRRRPLRSGGWRSRCQCGCCYCGRLSRQLSRTRGRIATAACQQTPDYENKDEFSFEDFFHRIKNGSLHRLVPFLPISQPVVCRVFIGIRQSRIVIDRLNERIDGSIHQHYVRGDMDELGGLLADNMSTQ